MTVALRIFLFILLCTCASLADLDMCDELLGLKPVGNNLTCYEDRILWAMKRHHARFIDFGNSPQTLFLDSAVCLDEDASNFQWKFIPRTATPPIFEHDVHSNYDGSFILKDTLLMDVPVVNNREQCLIGNSGDLYLSGINAERFTGTYVCMHKSDKTHPTNFIWYHVDHIYPQYPQTITIPGVPEMTSVESYEQMMQMEAIAKRGLAEYIGWHDRRSGPFTMTSELFEEEVYIGQCGPLKVGHEKRCYVSIPVIEPTVYNRSNHLHAYRVLRDAFDFLAHAPGHTKQSGRRAQEVVREQMRDVRFDFHGNGTFIYIPCGYSLFRHLFGIVEELAGFPGASYRLEVTYDVACVDAGITDLIEFARLSDFSKDKFEIAPLLDFRYIKIQRLVFEGEKGLELRCPSHIPLSCNSSFSAEAIWKSGNDLTFEKRRSENDNVYVTTECALHFTVVHRYDVDIYYCYLRGGVKPTEVWSNKPRIAYRLQMEQAVFSWPRENDVLVGLVVLMVWSVFLVLVWIVLSLYDSLTREHAVFEATVKHAGGRMARLKSVYSPFSDEDKRLFFKVIPRE